MIHCAIELKKETGNKKMCRDGCEGKDKYG